MKKLTLSIFLLMLSYNAFSQSREVYEHSNSFYKYKVTHKYREKLAASA